MFTIKLVFEYTLFQQVISFQVCTLYMLYLLSLALGKPGLLSNPE